MDAPARAKLVGGWWFPNYDRNFAGLIKENLRNHAHPVAPDGRVLYQRHKLLLAMDLLPPGRRRVAVDVGAHVGMWGRQLCELFHTVHAFEPHAEVSRLWPWNVPHENYVMNAVALGATEGLCELWCHPSVSGDNYPVPGRSGTTPRHTLDKRVRGDVDLIKIDVQGGELDVLRGARETLERCRPVLVVEQKGLDQERFDDGKLAAVRYLMDMGAEAYAVAQGDWVMYWPAR